MKTAVTQKFQQDIEVEQLWAATQNGKYVFFVMQPVLVLTVFALWHSAAHSRLLFWLCMAMMVHVVRLVMFSYYYQHKSVLARSMPRFKRMLIFVATLTSVTWVLCIYWFIDPAYPQTSMLVTLTLFFEGVGSTLTWICYLPASLIMSLPTTIAGMFILYTMDDRILNAAAVLLLPYPITGTLFRFKITAMLQHAFRLNFENAELRKEAEQANVAKTRFLAAASHDLRQPIHALGLFFAELSEQTKALETVGVMRQINDTIYTIDSMLNALLDVSKLDAGIIKPTLAPVALHDIFKRLQAEFQPLALENDNSLRIRASTAYVYSDAVMLERILRNLISNAIRYTKHGRILVVARKRHQHLLLQVWDNGIGIPSDQLEEIFIEFHQLQNPARNRHQGLGLGLAIVKRLAKLLEHPVQVQSRLGRGSCFTLSVPLASMPSLRTPQLATESITFPPNILSGCRVLVLDDDTAVLQGMHALLTRWGCQVMCASTPTTAMQQLAAATDSLQLLIIDYRLSDNASGISLAQSIQQQLGYPLAVLVITGDTGPERLREADASGYPLLHKPVQPAKLRATLQYLLSHHPAS